MDKLKITLEPTGAERLPLADVLQLAERRLIEGQVVQRAKQSSLYAEPWRRAGVDVAAVKRRDDLRRLPFARGSQVVEAEKRQPLHRLPCTKAWAWFATDAPGEGRKWIPYAKQDLLLYMGLLARLSAVTGIKDGDVFLTVAPMAPRITNAMPYLWLYTDVVDTQQDLEFLVGSMFMLGRSNWTDFALRRQPTVLLCRPQDALDLVEHFAKAAGSPDAKPKQLFKRLRAGIFFGQPLAPRRDDIVAAYGIEAFDCYFTTDFGEYREHIIQAKALLRAGEWGFAKREFMRAFRLFRGEPFRKMYDDWSDDKRLEILFNYETEVKLFIKELLKREKQKEADQMLARARKAIPDFQV